MFDHMAELDSAEGDYRLQMHSKPDSTVVEYFDYLNLTDLTINLLIFYFFLPEYLNNPEIIIK
jgi:hypothetical protein